jgi:hypothetical protein
MFIADSSFFYTTVGLEDRDAAYAWTNLALQVAVFDTENAAKFDVIGDFKMLLVLK